MKKIIILLLILIISINAKIPRVFVSVKQKDIKAGDKVEIMIGAEAQKGSKIILPKVDSIGGFKVISKKVLNTSQTIKSNKKKKVLIKRAIIYTIKPKNNFDINSFIIKIGGKKYNTVPFRVKVVSKNNKSASNKTNKNKDKKRVDKNGSKESSKNSAKKVSKQKETIKQKNITKKELKIVKTVIVTKKSNSVDKSSNFTQNSDFIFKMSSSKNRVVVGESFIVKVELLEPINLSSSDLQYFPPKFKNFEAKPIGEGKIEEGNSSVIRTIEYIVIPKKRGNFTITPARAKVGIQLTPQTQSPFGFFGADIEWKKLKTNSLKIEVDKLPQNVDLVGKFKIESDYNTKRAKPNHPYRYIIKIIGLGNLDNFEFPDIKVNNLTVYKEEPKIDHIMTKGLVITTLIQPYVFISDKNFKIPSIKLRVFNPDDKKIYFLKTEPLYVKIKKANSITSVLTSKKGGHKITDALKRNDIKYAPLPKEQKVSKKESILEPKEIKRVEELLLDKFYYKRKYGSGYSLSAIFGALFLGLILGVGAVILVPGLFRVSKSKKVFKKQEFSSYDEALNILYPHITKNKSIEKMVANLYEVINGNNEIKIDEYALNRMIKRVKEEKV